MPITVTPAVIKSADVALIVAPIASIWLGQSLRAAILSDRTARLKSACRSPSAKNSSAEWLTSAMHCGLVLGRWINRIPRLPPIDSGRVAQIESEKFGAFTSCRRRDRRFLAVKTSKWASHRQAAFVIAAVLPQVVLPTRLPAVDRHRDDDLFL